MPEIAQLVAQLGFHPNSTDSGARGTGHLKEEEILKRKRRVKRMTREEKT